LDSQSYISHLQLHAHPEGGYFGEHYRSSLNLDLPEFQGLRSASTAIYFLLEAGQFSALHAIRSDEIWHFYDGDPLEIVELDSQGNWTSTLLGRDLLAGQKLSHCVPAGHWFGSRPAPGSIFSLVGCTVAPGFDFQDFEMPDQSWFLDRFPNLEQKIRLFTR
jgi:hypothetical protein